MVEARRTLELVGAAGFQGSSTMSSVLAPSQ
jgi:hypothetical protein